MLAVDNLVTVTVCLSGLLARVVMIRLGDDKTWDEYGPQLIKGSFLEYEVGVHDCVYKGWVHTLGEFAYNAYTTPVAG